MEIRQLTDAAEKQAVTRLILEALPEWFGIPEAREEYIRESAGRIFFCAYDRNRPVGFLYLKETGNATVELYVMGIRKEYHRQGIGRLLFRQARDAAAGAGYAFMQVKTVQMGKYEEYDRTNRFYLALGFREFEVFPTCGTKETPARCTSCPWNRPQIPLTRREKHGILMLLQAMMGAAARSRGRKCPPDAPLSAQECGCIQIQVEPRTLFRSP
mgnify:CR=1 FL=1